MKKIILFLCIFFFPLLASAHATPVEYSPDEFASVSSTPNEVMIRFSERVEPSASSIEIYAPSGEKLPPGNSTVNKIDTHVFSRSATSGGEGIYTVSWQVVSADDGHFTRGAFPFFVGSGTTSAILYGGTVEMVYSAGYGEATTIFLKLLGESMLVGLLALFFFFGWQRAGSEELRMALVANGKRFSYIALIILFLGTASYLYLKTSLLAEVQKTDFLGALPNFSATVAGKLSVLLLLLTPIFAYLSRGILEALIFRKRITMMHVFALVCLLVMSYSQARLSHAAASLFLPTFSVFVNLAHLFGKGLWIGSLLTFAFVFIPALALKKDFLEFQPNTRKALGYAIVCAVAIGGTTGAWIVWLHMKGFNNLWTTAWGNTFITLGLFAIILVSLRLFSILVFDRMKRCIDCERSYAYLECGVGLCVTFFSALIIITSPPLYHDGLWNNMTMDRGAMVHVSDPGEGSGSIRINGYDAIGNKITESAPIVTITNTRENIGPLVVQTKIRVGGDYDIPGTLFSPPGEWQVKITFQQKAAYDVNGSFLIDYPKVVTEARNDAQKIRFGPFEVLLATFGTLSLMFAYVLYYLAGRNADFSSLHPEYFRDIPTIGKIKASTVAFVALCAIIALVLVLGSALLGIVGAGAHDMHSMHKM